MGTPQASVYMSCAFKDLNMWMRLAWTCPPALAHKLPLAGTTAQPHQPRRYAHLQVLFESGLKERQAFIEAHMRRLT